MQYIVQCANLLKNVGGYILLAAALLCIYSMQAHAQGGAQGALQAQTERFAAMVRGDLDALRTMIAADANYTHTTGIVETREEFLEKQRSGGLRYNDIQIENRTVRLYGETAIINGTTAMKVTAGDVTLQVSMRFTDIYALIDGRWVMVSWQSTRMPEG